MMTRGTPNARCGPAWKNGTFSGPDLRNYKVAKANCAVNVNLTVSRGNGPTFRDFFIHFQ